VLGASATETRRPCPDRTPGVDIWVWRWRCVSRPVCPMCEAAEWAAQRPGCDGLGHGLVWCRLAGFPARTGRWVRPAPLWRRFVSFNGPGAALPRRSGLVGVPGHTGWSIIPGGWYRLARALRCPAASRSCCWRDGPVRAGGLPTGVCSFAMNGRPAGRGRPCRPVRGAGARLRDKAGHFAV
jgi:hypothetical protein